MRHQTDWLAANGYLLDSRKLRDGHDDSNAWAKQKVAQPGLHSLRLSKPDIRFWSHIVFQFDSHYQVLRIHSMNIVRRKRVHSRNKNLGVAAVETALCVTALIPIMFGTLEICSGYYLQESLTIAAYEGARTAARQDSTPEDVREYVTELLDDRGVDIVDGNIVITPASFENRRELNPVTITISVPTANNSIFVFQHLANRTLVAEVTFAFETGLPPLNLNTP